MTHRKTKFCVPTAVCSVVVFVIIRTAVKIQIFVVVFFVPCSPSRPCEGLPPRQHSECFQLAGWCLIWTRRQTKTLDNDNDCSASNNRFVTGDADHVFIPARRKQDKTRGNHRLMFRANLRRNRITGNSDEAVPWHLQSKERMKEVIFRARSDPCTLQVNTRYFLAGTTVAKQLE